MNHVFRIIWSHACNQWVVVSELTRRHGKAANGGSLMLRRTPSQAVFMRCGLLTTLLGMALPAQATDYYWDVNGVLPGSGGPTPHGIWSAADTTLSLSAAGTVAVVPHSNSTADRVFFSAGTDATGAYTVIVSGTQNIGRLTFQEGSVNLVGGTINFGAVSGLIDGDGMADSISSVLSGTNGLRFSGGTVTLSGSAANTYIGTTTVGGSGLAQASVILAAAGGNAFSGNFVQMGGGGAYSTGGSVTLGAANQINDIATVSMASTHYSGSSVFSLNGFDETIGGITLSHVGEGSAVILRNGAATEATVTLAGSGTYSTANGDRVYGRSIQDGGVGKLNVVVALTGTGSQTFSGSNVAYTGRTTVNSGTLRLTNTSTWASDVTLNGGIVELQQNTAATGTYAGAATRTHARTIGGTGGVLRKTGNGTVILSGVNTYQGATSIQAGMLQAGSSSAFGSNSAVTLADVAGAALNLNGFNTSIGSLAGGGGAGGNVTLGTAILTTGNDNTSTLYAGVVSGAGGLTKSGAGTQTLTGTNTFSGATNINAGSLQLGAGGTTGALGSGAVTIAAGATLGFDRSNLYSVANTINGPGTLAQTGSGTTTLTAATNTIGGIVVSGGTLDIDAVLNTATVSIGNGVLNVDGTVQADGATHTAVSGVAGTASVVNVNGGANLLGNGDLGDGSDVLDVTGTLDTGAGTFNLGAGDDTFAVHDGTNVIGAVDGGAGLDTRVYGIDTTANLGALLNFEGLTKTGTGVLNVTGPGTSSLAQVQVLGGTLDIGAAAGLVEVTSATVASGATLNVDGQFGFTSGADSFTVGGNVTGLSSIDLLDGDDLLTIQDGANLSGLVSSINGGLGNDTLTADISGAAILGGAANFETLIKSNSGTLNINGPANSQFDTVRVQGGTLAIASGVTVDPQTTVVSTGAMLTVDGFYNGTLGADTFTVSGTVNGTGAIALLDGDDALTINDGADLSGLANAIDGGAHAGSDTVVLDNVATLSLSGNNVANFERLQKNGTGIATLTGTHAFSAGITIHGGTLDVDGTLDTGPVILADGTTLNVDGIAQAAGPSQTTITGSVGTNTVNVDAGATLMSGGDLGDGSDVLDVAGTLNTGSGTFFLGAGDDTFVVHDTTAVVGTLDAGLGNDLLNVNVGGGNLVPLGSTMGFESLGKSGLGTLQINGPSSFIDVDVQAGLLQVGGSGSVAAQVTTIAAGARLQVDGAYAGTPGNDSMTVAGTVTGTGSVDLQGGSDTFTLADGADLNGLLNAIDGGADSDTLVSDLSGIATLGGAVNFESLVKTNTGTLLVAGPAASAFTAVDVQGGTLDIGAAGSIDGVVTTMVASGATLNIDGRYAGTGGADTITVAGTLTGAGMVDLASGNDVLTVTDGADLSGLINAIDGGADTDTVQATINSSANLAPTTNFETLIKNGSGTLSLLGSQVYLTSRLDAGMLTVGSGTTLASRDTTVATGATLDVQGAFVGTVGDDTFASSGVVRGTLAFGMGNDDVDFFTGSDFSGLTGLSGGGGSDDLNFNGLVLTSVTLPPFEGWEAVNLRASSELTLIAPLDLTSNGSLTIDATSQLIANVGARLIGNLRNAGLITVGSHRFGISGNYSASSLLELAVSPGSLSSGGLDIGGDVTGTTQVMFNSDGTDAPQQPASILIISSPNDDRGTAGSFIPIGGGGGVVRLNGSVLPWTFDQHADSNWYLSAQAALLPEIGGYAAVPSIGLAGIQDTKRVLFDRMLFDRLSDVRDGMQQCVAHEEDRRRANLSLTSDCEGLWVAATAGELEMGADPGFAFSGDNLGLYAGVDTVLQDRATRALRGGLFAGFQRGNYWTTGANSTGLPGMGEANVRVDTPTVGLYGSVNWSGGIYVHASLVGQLPEATVAVTDAINESINGNSLTLSAQFGRRFPLANGWTLAPELELSASAMHWEDKVDARGMQLVLDDDVLGMARAALRAEKEFETASGARVHPWVTLGLQDIVGEKDNALFVGASGTNAQLLAFPGHELGLAATLDVGAEAVLGEVASLFGTLSYGHSLDGSESEQRQINLGVRIRW